MNQIRILIAALVLMSAVNVFGHGTIQFPDCLFGGAYFSESAYVCKLQIVDHDEVQAFSFNDILSGQLPSWKMQDGIAARYTTAKESNLTLYSVVSCPLKDEKVSSEVIDIWLAVENDATGFRNSLRLTDVSVAEKRTFHTALFMGEFEGEAYVTCTRK